MHYTFSVSRSKYNFHIWILTDFLLHDRCVLGLEVNYKLNVIDMSSFHDTQQLQDI